MSSLSLSLSLSHSAAGSALSLHATPTTSLVAKKSREMLAENSFGLRGTGGAGQDGISTRTEKVCSILRKSNVSLRNCVYESRAKRYEKGFLGFGSVFSRDLVGMALCVFTWATKQSKTKETQTKKRVSQVGRPKETETERERNRERPADLPGLPSLGRRRDAGSQTPAQHLRTTAENLNSYSLLRCRCWIVLNT